MKLKTKAFLLNIVIFFVTFLVIHFILNYFFKDLKGAYVAGISGGLTAMLAPRAKNIKTQSGDHIQMTWIFSKKVRT
ncbi:MAG: hypothetical protein HKP59_11425 [Lutibacter sp.]|uniref:hypothetical protein n=1 Tax=Lutibacter sp. TaxID=1925666 RepID=UPI001823E1F3|nr:hypothetical protein [Lutibacter sp.]MBT8318223.1 hypothetical protein [Lutibacter sp.]NNJ59082.1 hypothetical protein [Lutibacter sp.]